MKYQCSAWLSMNVQTECISAPDPSFNPREVLISMRDYIHHFLGCRECANNFEKMAKQIRYIRRPKDGVLFLWRAHNKANRRLHNDPSEDPQHPKVEFPSPEACPSCRLTTPEGVPLVDENNVTLWNEDRVLHYLRRFYGADYIIQDALPFTYRRSE